MSTPREAQINSEVPPPALLLQMITGRWVSHHPLRQLGIATARRRRQSSKTAGASGVHSQSLYRVLRALTSLGIFAERDPGVFELTPMAEYLRTGVPGSMRAAAIMFGEDWHYRPWGHVLHSVQTGQTAFSHVFGQNVFPTRSERGLKNIQRFNAGAASAAIPRFRPLVFQTPLVSLTSARP